jgi:hypothetical protein
MTAMGRALLVSVVVLTAVSARAQSAVLPPVPELKLQFPVQPLRFSFSGAEVRGAQDGPLRLYLAESLWLKTPRLQLLTFGAGERALELDCRQLCQPIVQTVVATELRVKMPNPSPLVTDTHAFLRFSSGRTPVINNRLGIIHAGIAGAF